MDFTNKVVLITGASAGVGEHTALLFAKYGAKLSLVGRNEKNLQDVADRCEKLKGLKPLAIVADLGTDEGVEKTAKDTLDHFGRLDVLVNNAAVGARTTIERADMETFDRVFNVNIRGVFNLTRLLVPALISSKGNIVNVSSIMATMVTTGNLPYSLSKAALDHFSRLIAFELAPKGVRVNVVSPGITVSTFVQRLTGYTDEEYRAWLRTAEGTIPFGSASTGEDCAHMIAQLASDELSRVVTGAIIPVDGALQFVGGGGNSEVLKDQIK
ncbi:3-oxoacyl-[acyl-carrier-protein] reductase FabG-like [Anticarsia gemmatalis]|uniref:3-oxoacyl-[acyl-carrier-protein] reductase FabG-like n=1 Tax=Anticarsia gemmatalis TaxID=129554 RepID=UPI003F777F62